MKRCVIRVLATGLACHPTQNGSRNPPFRMTRGNSRIRSCRNHWRIQPSTGTGPRVRRGRNRVGVQGKALW